MTSARSHPFVVVVALLALVVVVVAVAFTLLRTPPVSTATTEAQTPSTPASPSPSPLATPVATGPIDVRGVDGLGDWSPDGQHLFVDTDGSVQVIDQTGRQVGTIEAGLGDEGWLDSTTIAALVTHGPSATGQVRFYDITGGATGRLDGEFERIVVSTGNDLFAAVAPAVGGDNVGRSYTVWDGGVVADTRQGEPLTWSDDGSLLAVLIPTGSAAGMGGDEGSLAIVARNGESVSQIPHWSTTTYGDVRTFSHDGRYLAVCLSDPANPRNPKTLRVIDVQTGSVSESLESSCDYQSGVWRQNSTLYISNGLSRPHVWTPDAGLSGLEIANRMRVTPSFDGRLAIWSDGSPDSTIQLADGAQKTSYQLPGLRNVSWSPDGQSVVALWGPNGSGVPVATLISVAPSH